MFIELSPLLRCPTPHEDCHLVLATGAMRARHVVFGTLGCPTCKGEYPIVGEVASFGRPPGLPDPGSPLPDPEAVAALLKLESPGGFAVLVGSAAGLAPGLATALEGVHLVCVNAGKAASAGGGRSLLESSATVPLRTGVGRGVVLGAECRADPWPAEAARVLLRGQHLVALTEDLTPPAGLERLAAGQGMWVGRKS